MLPLDLSTKSTVSNNNETFTGYSYTGYPTSSTHRSSTGIHRPEQSHPLDLSCKTPDRSSVTKHEDSLESGDTLHTSLLPDSSETTEWVSSISTRPIIHKKCWFCYTPGHFKRHCTLYHLYYWFGSDLDILQKYQLMDDNIRYVLETCSAQKHKPAKLSWMSPDINALLDEWDSLFVLLAGSMFVHLLERNYSLTCWKKVQNFSN